jgi:hypothetical protein
MELLYIIGFFILPLFYEQEANRKPPKGSTNYRALDTSYVGTGAVWMTGGGACAVQVPRTAW